MSETTITVSTNGTAGMICARCGAYTNPSHYVDGLLLCRLCAGIPHGNPTFPCPFCRGTGRMS